MDIYQAVGYRLKHGTAVTAITGTAAIFYGLRPEGGSPCINFFEAGYIPLHNGVVESAQYQISCRADTPIGVQQLAREVVVLFHNFKGTINGTFDIQGTTVEGKLMIPEPDTNLYHVPLDVRFTYNESTVT